MHWSAIILLALTILACWYHLVPGLRPSVSVPFGLSPPALTFLCGFLPALGTALAGINNHGEFKRIAKRSEAMQEQLYQLQTETEKLRIKINDDDNPKPQQYSGELGKLSAGQRGSS